MEKGIPPLIGCLTFLVNHSKSNDVEVQGIAIPSAVVSRNAFIFLDFARESTGGVDRFDRIIRLEERSFGDSIVSSNDVHRNFIHVSTSPSKLTHDRQRLCMRKLRTCSEKDEYELLIRSCDQLAFVRVDLFCRYDLSDVH